MAWRDIQQRLSQDDRAKWDKETCTKALEKLAHMGLGEIKGGKQGAIHFKKIKDWEQCWNCRRIVGWRISTLNLLGQHQLREVL